MYALYCTLVWMVLLIWLGSKVVRESKNHFPVPCRLDYHLLLYKAMIFFTNI